MDDIGKLAAKYDSSKWFQEGSTVTVQLSALEELTRCPICYGKIKNARVSSVCLHRFCAGCIEQCLRSCDIPGRKPEVKECPVCRAHLTSRRCAKPDLKFDQVMKALYGNIAEYEREEEELMALQTKALAQQWSQELEHMHQLQAIQQAAVATRRHGNSANHNGNHNSRQHGAIPCSPNSARTSHGSSGQKDIQSNGQSRQRSGSIGSNGKKSKRAKRAEAPDCGGKGGCQKTGGQKVVAAAGGSKTGRPLVSRLQPRGMKKSGIRVTGVGVGASRGMASLGKRGVKRDGSKANVQKMPTKRPRR